VTAQRILLPDLDPDEQLVLDHDLAQLNAKTERNRLRAAYYDAKRTTEDLWPVWNVVPPFYRRLAMVLGWSGKAVDALARRCNLNGFVWPDGDLASLGYQELWDGNWLGSEVNQAVVSALIHATGFVVTTQGEEGEPPALIHFRDALNATGTWNPRTRRLDDFLSITGRDDKNRVTSLNFYLDGVTITAERDVSSRGGWTVERSEHSWGVPADPLPYRPRLNRPFGSSRLSRPVLSIQDAALRELLRFEGHMDVYSFPDFWLLGADESVFKREGQAQPAAWQVVLGRIKGIPDDDTAETPRADVKQFPAASPQPHLAALNALAKLFAREASLPDTAVAITDVSNPTSAESYDAAQNELIAEAEETVANFAPALRRAMIRALAMANGETEIPKQWLSIDTRWRDPRYLSKAAQADAGMKQLTAIPWLADTEVGLELLGLDPQQMKRALAEHRKVQARQLITQLTTPQPPAATPPAPAQG
jgi:hypothetical protein